MDGGTCAEGMQGKLFWDLAGTISNYTCMTEHRGTTNQTTLFYLDDFAFENKAMSSTTSCGNRVSAVIANIVGALDLSQTRSIYWLDAGIGDFDSRAWLVVAYPYLDQRLAVT